MLVSGVCMARVLVRIGGYIAEPSGLEAVRKKCRLLLQTSHARA